MHLAHTREYMKGELLSAKVKVSEADRTVLNTAYSSQAINA